jgi:hypothetical protein
MLDSCPFFAWGMFKSRSPQLFDFSGSRQNVDASIRATGATRKPKLDPVSGRLVQKLIRKLREPSQAKD